VIFISFVLFLICYSITFFRAYACTEQVFFVFCIIPVVTVGVYTSSSSSTAITA